MHNLICYKPDTNSGAIQNTFRHPITAARRTYGLRSCKPAINGSLKYSSRSGTLYGSHDPVKHPIICKDTT